MGDCRDKAFDLVARRPHFRRELERKLQARGFDAGEISVVLEELAGLGALDDLENAVNLAAGSLTRKGYGPRRMRFDLQRRGAEESAADRAVSQIFPDAETEARRAKEVVDSKCRAGAIDNERLARHLDRKGFSKAVILRVLDGLEGD